MGLFNASWYKFCLIAVCVLCWDKFCVVARMGCVFINKYWDSFFSPAGMGGVWSTVYILASMGLVLSLRLCILCHRWLVISLLILCPRWHGLVNTSWIAFSVLSGTCWDAFCFLTSMEGVWSIYEEMNFVSPFHGRFWSTKFEIHFVFSLA